MWACPFAPNERLPLPCLGRRDVPAQTGSCRQSGRGGDSAGDWPRGSEALSMCPGASPQTHETRFEADPQGRRRPCPRYARVGETAILLAPSERERPATRRSTTVPCPADAGEARRASRWGSDGREPRRGCRCRCRHDHRHEPPSRPGTGRRRLRSPEAPRRRLRLRSLEEVGRSAQDPCRKATALPRHVLVPVGPAAARRRLSEPRRPRMAQRGISRDDRQGLRYRRWYGLRGCAEIRMTPGLMACRTYPRDEGVRGSSPRVGLENCRSRAASSGVWRSAALAVDAGTACAAARDTTRAWRECVSGASCEGKCSVQLSWRQPHTFPKVFGTIERCLSRTTWRRSAAVDQHELLSTSAFASRSASCAIAWAACRHQSKPTASGAGYGSRRHTTRPRSRAIRSCSSRSSNCWTRAVQSAIRSCASTWRCAGTLMLPIGSMAKRSTLAHGR